MNPVLFKAMVKNSYDIVKTLKNYFVNVGKPLADKILPTPSQTCQKYLRNLNQNSIFVDVPRPNEVYNIINFVQCKTSPKEKVISFYICRVAGHCWHLI